jgi:hypothetical protein
MDRGTTKFGYSWAAYKAIEEDMMRVIEYLPLETRQYNIYSFKLTDIIIRSCSHIDSLFKDILRNQDLSDHPNQQEVTTAREKLVKRKMLKIDDYIKIFADYLNLTSVKVTIRRNDEPKKPFEKFENSNLGGRSSVWWKAYNSLKHDFYNEKNVEKGNLGNALESLGALFVLNCKIPLHFKLEENINYLVSNRVITSPNFVQIGRLLKYIKEDPKLEKYSLVAATDLFEYWLSHHPETIELTVLGELAVEDSLYIPAEGP